MIIFNLYIIFTSCDYIDKLGVSFKDESMIKLIKTPTNLIQYQIPEQTEIIGGGSDYRDHKGSAFFECRNVISKLFFPVNSKLRQIEAYGFAYLSKITEINLSNCSNLISLSQGAFYGCTKIKSFILPPFLESIDGGALGSLKSLTELSFPSTVSYIGGWSNYGTTIADCDSLTHISWGDKPVINTISGFAFCRDNLTEFEIPASLKSFTPSAIASNPITRFIIHPSNPLFSSDGFVLYKNNITIAFVSYAQTGSFVIPDSISIIGHSAFVYSRVTSVEIPSTVTEIQGDAFYSSSLTSITVPPSVVKMSNRVFMMSKITTICLNASIKTLPPETFYNCPNLISLIIPPLVESIRKNAFYNCKAIQYIFIPKSVKEISPGAFDGMNKSAVIDIDKESPLKIANETIFSSNFDRIIAYIGTSETVEVYVCPTVKNISASAFKGVGVDSITFESGSELIEICDMAFMQTKLTNIIFPRSLRYIRTSAFEQCTLLSSVSFLSMDTMEEISDRAFLGATFNLLSLPGSIEVLGEMALSVKELTNFIINGEIKLKKIGSSCFKGSSITSFNVPSSVETIGGDAFSGSKLRQVIFRSGPESNNNWTISESAFRGCKELEEINFGSRVGTIGRSAFSGCSGLKDVALSDSIESVKEYAFSGCTQLSTFSIGEGSKLKEIGTLAFDDCIKLKKFNVSNDNPSFEAKDGALYRNGRRELVAYLPAAPEKKYVVPGEVTEITAYTFQNAANLEVVLFDDGTYKVSEPIEKRIGYGAFKNCKKLQLVELPQFIIEVGQMAFDGCTLLKCSSIVYHKDLMPDLLNSGAPKEALSPCPSASFTITPPSPLTASAALITPQISGE